MFRTRILIPVLAVTAGLFVATASVDAHPPMKGGLVAKPYFVPAVRVYRPAPVVIVPATAYQVVYRANCYQPWVTYQSYYSYAFAQDVAGQLGLQGYETAIWQ
jgi:hypothetical protein